MNSAGNAPAPYWTADRRPERDRAARPYDGDEIERSEDDELISPHPGIGGILADPSRRHARMRG